MNSIEMSILKKTICDASKLLNTAKKCNKIFGESVVDTELLAEKINQMNKKVEKETELSDLAGGY